MRDLFGRIFFSVVMLTPLISCTQSHEHPLPPPTVVYEKPDQPIPDPRPAPRPGFQTLDTIEDSILLDLQNLDSDAERRDARYLVGCDRLNLWQDLSEYEQGINRGINQLSTDRELYPVTAIGPGNCIYRFELSKIGWTRSDWQTLENNDILFFISNTVRNKNIQFLTQTQRPYVYGSSAMITAFEGDAVADKKGAVYYKLVHQDLNTAKFLAQQGVDRQAEVNDEEAMFSGFSQSQIALGKTRLIAVFESREGTCISTYDTALGGDDLFTNPFTVELQRAGQINGQINTNKVFKHNAQEHICTLPNGLFGLYRLNDNLDNAQVVAPTNIVINTEGARIDPSIRIGDCSNCHYKDGAAIPFKDQLRAHVVGNSAFNQVEKRLATIFFRQDQVSAQIDQLNKEHARAMQVLGITAGSDPLWNVVGKPLRQEMSIDQVASLTWLDTKTFRDRLAGTARSSQVFGNLLGGGTVSLAVLSANFKTLVDELAIYEDNNL